MSVKLSDEKKNTTGCYVLYTYTYIINSNNCVFEFVQDLINWWMLSYLSKWRNLLRVFLAQTVLLISINCKIKRKFKSLLSQIIIAFCCFQTVHYHWIEQQKSASDIIWVRSQVAIEIIANFENRRISKKPFRTFIQQNINHFEYDSPNYWDRDLFDRFLQNMACDINSIFSSCIIIRSE